MKNKFLLSFLLLIGCFFSFSCQDTDNASGLVSDAKLVESTPADGATNVSTKVSKITLTFNKAVSIVSNWDSFTLEPET